MKKPKRKSLLVNLQSHILSKTGLAVGLVGIGIFTTVAVLTSRISYPDNPRQQVQDFAKKISLISFKLGDLTVDDNYNSIKKIIFDENGKKQTDLDFNRLVDVFQKTNGSLNQKVDFGEEIDKTKPHLEFLEIKPNDQSHSFEIKYRVAQKLADGNFVYSDNYTQDISFSQKSQFLRSNFNASLQKLVKIFRTKFTSITGEAIAKQFAEQETKKSDSTISPYLKRAQDVADYFNLSRQQKELESKIDKWFPNAKQVLLQLYHDKNNLIPDTNNKIFNFSFAKNQFSNQYATVDHKDNLSLFLQAQFSADAQKLLNYPDVKEWIEPIKLIKDDGSSLFSSSKSLIENLVLKKIKPKKAINLSAFDFFSLLQKKSTFSIFDASKDTTEKINQILEEPLAFDFGKFSNLVSSASLNQKGLNVIFDPFSAEILKKDGNFVVSIPYKIQILASFYGKNSDEIIEEKSGKLELSHFSSTESGQEQNTTSNSAREFIYKKSDLQLSEAQRANEKLNPKYFLLDSNNPYSPNEIKKLIENGEFSKLKAKIGAQSGYKYNFSNHESLVNSWTGKSNFPKETDFKNFKKDESLQAKETHTLSLDSSKFLQNPHEIAAFYSSLTKQNPQKIVKTFFELLKAAGLIFDFADLDNDFQFNWNNIFKSASKIRLNSQNYTSLSFNNQYANIDSSSFLATLFLPENLKNQIKKLENDSEILSKLTSQKLFNDKNEQILKDVFQSYEEATNFETLADVLAAFYYKVGLLDNFATWSQIGELDSEIVFNEVDDAENEKNLEDAKSEIEKLKSDSGASSSKDSQETEQKNFKSITYFYKIGKKDATGKISTPVFETPKTTLILKTISEKQAKVNEITKKLDEIIDAIPVSYETIYLTEEEFQKLTNNGSGTDSTQAAQMVAAKIAKSSLLLKNEDKHLITNFTDTEETTSQESEQVEAQEQTQETEAPAAPAPAEKSSPESSENENDLTKKLPKVGKLISDIIKENYKKLFNLKDDSKLKIKVEVRNNDNFGDQNQKRLTIQVGIPEDYIEEIGKETEQPKTENDESEKATKPSDAEGRTEEATTEESSTSDTTASETTVSQTVSETAPAETAAPAPAEKSPVEPKEEKYRYSKKFNITVIKKSSQTTAETEEPKQK
ncbi:P97 family adhesin [Mesomycoplasma dispar]|uniref:P97/LppS family protein n=1 Tax=Mesomycoplasma dispar TaxID=86660 RepID=A0ABN5DTU9_9BACT|nr:hypothetical protein [Mesomycoplasma dispar]ATP59580.1 hypothetical protein CSW10_01280 [Mesomycoplasma dispar]